MTSLDLRILQEVQSLSQPFFFFFFSFGGGGGGEGEGMSHNAPPKKRLLKSESHSFPEQLFLWGSVA